VGRGLLELCEAGCADAAGIARVHVEGWLSTYRGIVPDASLARRSLERRARFWSDVLCRARREEAVHVAVDPAGQIVGFASGGPRREGPAEYAGELYAIYLLPGARRRGLGRRLTVAVAHELTARGLDSMLLWVLADNCPARGFYEALGGQMVDRRRVDFDGVLLDEVAYGWHGEAFARLAALADGGA